jgi:ketosteroid isomerase-like protein
LEVIRGGLIRSSRRGLLMKSLGLILLLGLTVSSIAAQEESADVSKIVAMEKAWNQAFKLRDTKAIDALLDDGVVLVNDDGSLMSKSSFLAAVRSSGSSDDQQVTPESINVHVIHGVAVATGVFRSKGSENGKSFVRRNRFADTWVKKNDTWVCVSASATPILH